MLIQRSLLVNFLYFCFVWRNGLRNVPKASTQRPHTGHHPAGTSVWWCSARLQVELTSSPLTPAVGGSGGSGVGGNNASSCSRCSEHNYSSPPGLRGATAPSVPGLPAPVPVTSPPVLAKLAGQAAVSQNQNQEDSGAGLQNRCDEVWSQSESHDQVEANEDCPSRHGQLPVLNPSHSCERCNKSSVTAGALNLSCSLEAGSWGTDMHYF